MACGTLATRLRPTLLPLQRPTASLVGQLPSGIVCKHPSSDGVRFRMQRSSPFTVSRVLRVGRRSHRPLHGRVKTTIGASGVYRPLHVRRAVQMSAGRHGVNVVSVLEDESSSGISGTEPLGDKEMSSTHLTIILEDGEGVSRMSAARQIAFEEWMTSHARAVSVHESNSKG
eukprot:9468297-Pyramimonas_sp.AAC.2